MDTSAGSCMYKASARCFQAITGNCLFAISESHDSGAMTKWGVDVEIDGSDPIALA
jgi:hypothetical protein